MVIPVLSVGVVMRVELFDVGAANKDQSVACFRLNSEGEQTREIHTLCVCVDGFRLGSATYSPSVLEGGVRTCSRFDTCKV